MGCQPALVRPRSSTPGSAARAIPVGRGDHAASTRSPDRPPGAAGHRSTPSEPRQPATTRNLLNPDRRPARSAMRPGRAGRAAHSTRQSARAKALRVVGEERRGDFRHHEPLDTAPVVAETEEIKVVHPVVEPEIAAAIDPTRLRLPKGKSREGHHDWAERIASQTEVTRAMRTIAVGPPDADRRCLSIVIVGITERAKITGSAQLPLRILLSASSTGHDRRRARARC